MRAGKSKITRISCDSDKQADSQLEAPSFNAACSLARPDTFHHRVSLLLVFRIPILSTLYRVSHPPAKSHRYTYHLS